MKKIIVILLSVLALGCNNDEANNITNETSLDLVTGVNFRQEPEDFPFKLGNPNVLTNSKFVIYPNPANEVVYISTQEDITNVWFVPANPEKIHQDLNFNSILNTNLYTEQSISSRSNYSLSGEFSDNISIDIGTLEKGYYKVFVKIDGKIYWDNLYKYQKGADNEQAIIPIINFWE